MDFKYVINPFDDTPIMLINKHIGVDAEDGDGIIGDIFERELGLLDSMGKKSIEIYINSGGGNVDDGWSIFTSILRCKTPITTINEGLAASIAGVIFQAGQTRKAYAHSLTMIHNPWLKGAELTDEKKKVLDLYRQSIVVMLSKSTRLNSNEIATLMDETTWMNAEDCLEKGFCDEIVEYRETVEPVDIANLNENSIFNAWSIYDKVLNKIIKNKKTKMKQIEDLKEILSLPVDAKQVEVQNALKLSFPWLFEAAKEDVVVNEDEDEDESKMEAEDSVSNEDEDEAKCNEADEDIKAEDEDEDSTKNEVLDLKNQIEVLQNELKSYKNAAVEEFINKSIASGKISNEQKDHYLKLAKIDLAVVKDLIDALPMKATKMVNEINKPENVTKTKEAISNVKNAREIENEWNNYKFDLKSIFK